MKLNRKQLSFLITLFAMGNVLLLAYNIDLASQREEEYVIEMALLDEETLEELFEEESPEQNQNQETIKSHMAFNETAKPNYSEPEPLKTLDEIMEERATDQNSTNLLEGDAGFAASLSELKKQRAERKEQLGEREAQKKEFTNYLKDKRTSISYSLVDRTHFELPPPIYTCEQGGKVVINIEVNGDGYVIDASFNAKSSTTNNDCLVENAKAYALRAIFDSSDRPSQLGSITYLYQSK